MELNVAKMLKDIEAFDTKSLAETKCLIKDYISKLLDERQLTYDLIQLSSECCSIVSVIGKRTGKPPIVFTAHLGTKFLIATALTAFITLSKEVLDREIILVVIGDKEKNNKQHMQEIVKKYGNRLNHGYVINEGGGFFTENCGQKYYVVTVGEKGKCHVRVTLEASSSNVNSLQEDRSSNSFLKVLERLNSYVPMRELSTAYGMFMSYLNGGIENDFLRRMESHNSQDKIIAPKYTVSEITNGALKNNSFDFAIELLPSKTIEDANLLLKEIFEGLNVSYEITHFSQGFQSDCSCEFFDTLETVVNQYFCKGAKLIPMYGLKPTIGGFFGKSQMNVYGAAFLAKEIPFEKVMNLINYKNEALDDNVLELTVQAYLKLCKSTAVENDNILDADIIGNETLNISVKAYLDQLEEIEEEEEEEEIGTLSRNVKAYLGQLDEEDDDDIDIEPDEEDEETISLLSRSVKDYLEQFNQIDEEDEEESVEIETGTYTLSATVKAYLEQLKQEDNEYEEISFL